jgi:t-SNARE complex subunit (syntaxin)
MFLDFAMLVEQQGELLDQIEYQVKSASDYIEEGNKEVAQAIEIQKSIRKKQCCIIITCLVVIGVIVGIILASLAAQGRLGNYNHTL